MNEKRNLLFVTENEVKLEQILKQTQTITPENSMILQGYKQIIIQPFDELMRDIIITVYQKNIEEIIFVTAKEKREISTNLLKVLNENIDLKEKIEMFDYLFKNCMPEFPKKSVRDWLLGNNKTNDIKNNVDLIRNHPLMPSDIRVTELSFAQLVDWVNEENKFEKV